MKKNIVLLFILIGLLSVAYYFEELQAYKKYIAQRKKIELFSRKDANSLYSITYPYFKIIKDKGNKGYIIAENNLPVNTTKVNALIKTLSKINIQRVIKENEYQDSFFKNKKERFKLKFKDKFIELIIGKKLRFNDSFYIQIETNKDKKIIIASYQGPRLRLYTKNNHQNEERYLLIKTLFNAKEENFYDTKIITNKNWNTSKLDVFSRYNKSFSINFNTIKTNPLIKNNLQYKREKFIKTKNYLNNMKAETLYFPFNIKKLDKYAGHIKIHDKNGNIINLKLYRKLGSLKGNFILSDKSKYLFEVNQRTARIFFESHQNFWKIKDKSWEEIKDFSISFKRDKKSIPLRLLNQKKFLLSHLNKKYKKLEIRQTEFKKLLSMLNKRADFVRFKNKKEKDNTDTIYLKKNNITTKVFTENKQLIFENQTYGYRLIHYIGNSMPIGLKKEDYFR